MFNMFRKKEQESFGLKNTEKYTPAFLPKNVEDGHTDLSTFIVGDYSLLNDAFLAARYAECESKLSPLVQISDEFTLGDMGDSYVNAEWEFVKNKHEEEVAMHDLSGKNILKARAVRIQELQERIPKIKEKIIKRQQRIDALSDKHAKHAIRIGKIMIQLGLPITALAFVADFFVNTEFVQSILYSNANMLRILVVCLCLMSDGTMYALGSMVSKKSDTQATVLYRILFTAFILLFSVSVVGSIAIRVGSMPMIYGSFDAKGTWISNETFTVAEYALAIISSLATAVTGALSFFFSVDREYSCILSDSTPNVICDGTVPDFRDRGYTADMVKRAQLSVSADIIGQLDAAEPDSDEVDIAAATSLAVRKLRSNQIEGRDNILVYYGSGVSTSGLIDMTNVPICDLDIETSATNLASTMNLDMTGIRVVWYCCGDIAGAEQNPLSNNEKKIMKDFYSTWLSDMGADEVIFKEDTPLDGAYSFDYQVSVMKTELLLRSTGNIIGST